MKYFKQKKKYEILNQKKKEEKLAREYHSEFVDKFLKAYGKYLGEKFIDNFEKDLKELSTRNSDK